MTSYKAIRDGRFQRALLGLSLVLSLATIVHVLSVPPTSGYEPSIEAPYSMELFGAVVVCSLLGVFADGYADRQRYWWKFLVLLFLSYLLLFCLPLFRGYALYGRGNADVLFHLGEARSVASEGTIGSRNWYPIVHLLIAVLAQFGLPIEQSRYLLPLFFFALYLGFLYLYAKRVADRSSQAVLVLGCAAPLLFGRYHLSLHPSILSFFVVPVFLYLFEVRQDLRSSRRVTLLSFLFALFVLFFHPITTLLLVGLGFAYVLSPLLSRALRRPTTEHRRTMTVVCFVIVAFFTWYSQFDRLENNVIQFVAPALRTRTSTVDAQQAAARELSPTELLVQVLELYGPILIYAMLTSIFLFALVVGLRRRTTRKSDGEIVAHLVVGFAAAVVLVIYFTMSPTRGARYLIFAMALAAGALVTRRYTERRHRELGYVGVGAVVLVLLAAFLAVGGIYTDYNHLTYSEKAGAEHVLETEASDAEVASYSTSREITWYLLGYQQATESDGNPFPVGNLERAPPPSLGFDTESSELSEAFDEYPKRLFLTEHDQRAPHNGSHGAYTEAERNQLPEERTANKVYDNGETSIWQLESTARQ